MARSREGNRRGGRKGGRKGTAGAEKAQKDGIKGGLKKLIEAKREQNMFHRYLRQADVARMVGVGDFRTYERQFERNFEITPVKPDEKPRPRPRLVKVTKTKKLNNPI